MRGSLRWYVNLALFSSFVILLCYGIADVFICWPFYFGNSKPRFVCMNFKDRLANQMFQYAFAYSIAKEYDRELIVPDDTLLLKHFDIEPNVWELFDYNSHSCRCFTQKEDNLHCGYDENNVNISQHKNVAYEGYFQSWKYWRKYEKDMRIIFTFKYDIRKSAEKIFKDMVSSKGISQGDGTVFVGVHVRYWEEYYNSIIGKNQAPKSYLQHAVKYFRAKFNKVLFVVASNSIPVAREMLDNAPDAYFLEGNSPSVDMAVLTKTNHTIMTVGSFGWFIGWLTGGTTVYYKYPDAPGTKYARQFHPGKLDHFYPGWIGME